MNDVELLARLEGVPFSQWHTKARVIVGSATFFDAFSALSLAFALPVLIGLWRISPEQTGLLISSSYIGQLIGALLFSSLAEKFGRIPSAAAATGLMSIMSLACGFAWSFPTLLVCRFIQGIGVGGEMPVAAAYISELSRARGRGRFFLLYELIFPIGLMATGQIGAWVVPAFGWKAIFWIGGIPGLLVTLLLTSLPESPRWLISKGRLSEAEAIIKQIETSAHTVGALGEAQARQRAASTDERPGRSQTAPTVNRSRWFEVLGPAFRSRTLIVWTLWAMTYFVTNSLNNWLPSLYNTVYRLQLRQSLQAASLTNVAQVSVLLICIFCIDRIGRKKWTTVALTAGAGALVILSLNAANSARSVIVFATLSYGIIGSVNAVLYLYTPEIYPTRMRAIGTGLATCWLRLASAVGPFVVGIVVGRGGTRTVFLMFAAAALVGAFAATTMLETRGKRLEEIAT